MSLSGGRPLAPFGRRAAGTLTRHQIGPYVVLICHDPGGPRPGAGQFYMLSTATRWGGGVGGRPWLGRAFSVMRAGVRADGSVELAFLLEDVGPGTRRLCEVGPGEELLLVGPLGNGFAAPTEGRHPLLVGGGVGIAPLVILADQLGSRPEARLGFRDGSHAAALALLPGAELATDDGSAGHHGLVTDLLRSDLQADRRRQIYACGPPPMLEAVRAMCSELEVPGQLALESGMACGFGACFGCVMPTREGYVRLCVDGPVLDADSLESALVAGAGHHSDMERTGPPAIAG